MQLTEVLRGGRQCDEDGVEIIMSRQACHEAADEIERLRGLLCSCKNAMIVATPVTDWTAMIDHIAATLTPNVEVRRGHATEGETK